MLYRRVLTVVAASLGLLLIPNLVNAQYQQRFYVQGTGGVAVPAGALNKYVDPGAGAGLEVGYQLTDAVMLRVEGDFQHLNGTRLSGTTPVTTPDLDTWSTTGGIQADLVRLIGRRTDNRVQLLADVGAGFARLNSDRFAWASDPTNTSRKFEQTYFGAAGGLTVAYAPTKRTSLYVGGKVRSIFADRGETEDLAKIDPANLKNFRTAVMLPISAGLRVRI